MTGTKVKHTVNVMCAAVWAARIILGMTFIISGWAKCTDLWGFVYKIEEYLSVWGMASSVPREFTLVGAAALSIIEFCTGLLLATGCLRRASVWIATVIMAAMLPLSIYIYVADPVADCGCFGDLFVISNAATLGKNIVLTATAVFLLIYNRRAKPAYRPGLQWTVMALGLIYSLTLSFIGWHVQPTVDFRPCPVGSSMLADDESMERDLRFIYEKDGHTEQFTLDALPDSTWTYVGRAGDDADAWRPSLFDADGFEVTDDVIEAPDDTGNDVLLILTVPEPGVDYLLRARFANELYEYAIGHDMRMIAAVAASDESLDRWIALARPKFPVYSASDTSLKELVRGSMGLVILHNGTITLKRNFSNIDPDLLTRDNPFGSMWIISDGHLAAWLTGALAAALLLIWLPGIFYGERQRRNDDATQPTPPSL